MSGNFRPAPDADIRQHLDAVAGWGAASTTFETRHALYTLALEATLDRRASATPAPKKRAPVLITIPAGTSPSTCSCGMTFYFAPHPTTGRMHPVSIQHAYGRAPLPDADGQGISHYADCTDRDKHRARARSGHRVNA